MNTNVKLKYISYRILLHLNPLRQRVELLALYVNLTQFHQTILIYKYMFGKIGWGGDEAHVQWYILSNSENPVAGSLCVILTILIFNISNIYLELVA